MTAQDNATVRAGVNHVLTVVNAEWNERTDPTSVTHHSTTQVNVIHHRCSASLCAVDTYWEYVTAKRGGSERLEITTERHS